MKTNSVHREFRNMIYNPDADQVEEDREISNKPIIEISPGEKFDETYDVLDELGRGRFGTVYKAIEKKSKCWYVITMK